MSYEDVQQFLDTDVYIDKISRKIIMTSSNSVRKYELNENKKQVNFEIIDTTHLVYIKENNINYISLKEVADMYELDVVYNKNLNMLQLVSNQNELGTLNSKRVQGFLFKNKKSSRIILDTRNIEIVKNDDFYNKDEKYYTVKYTKDEQLILLFVLKRDITLEEEIEVKQDNINLNFQTLFYNDGSESLDKTQNAVIIEGLKLLSKNGEIEDSINGSIIKQAKELKKEIYITLNNGSYAINYDNSITTQMLQSSTARGNAIVSVYEIVQKYEIAAVVLDFRNFNGSYKQDYTQFIKELSSYLHSKGKKVMVYVPLDASFIDIHTIIKYVDSVILVQYGTKDITSKTSGSHSAISFIRDNLKNLQKDRVNMSKIIVEIPLYSILWTEKNNKVVDAEKINMKLLEEYIAKNNLTYTLDNKTGQNYIEYVKGSLKYKIWLEDEYSVKEKINLAKEYNILGVLLYKKGFESDNLVKELGGI